MLVMAFTVPAEVRLSITSEVGAGRASVPGWHGGRGRPAPRLAAAPPAEPAGPGAGGGRVGPALSFLETGRSKPSREMVLRLAERARGPAARAQPAAAGRRLRARLRRAGARRAGDGAGAGRARAVLRGHEPFPALVIDRWWDLVAANAAIALLDRRAPAAARPPATCCGSACTPTASRRGSRTSREWRAHLLDRLRRELAVTADPRLAELLDEAEGYPGGEASRARRARDRRPAARIDGASCRSSARSPPSARRSTSPSPSWHRGVPARRRGDRGVSERRMNGSVSDDLGPGTPG